MKMAENFSGIVSYFTFPDSLLMSPLLEKKLNAETSELLYYIRFVSYSTIVSIR